MGRGCGTRLACACAWLATVTVAAPAFAGEPWSDADPAAPPARLALTPSLGVRGAAEYRAQGTVITPLDLASTVDRNYAVIQHRLRLDGGVDWDDKIRLVTSVDLLDGVLWGDNGGAQGQDPQPTSGARVSTTNPNVAVPCIALRPGAPPTAASSYHYGLCPGDPLFVRRLYGDVVTPIGLFRVGRQPFTEGSTIAVNDGDGRKNRFGVADRGNSADRVLFATKPLEALKAPADRDVTETHGLFLILAYDQLVTGDPMRYADDLHGWISAVRWLPNDGRAAKDTEVRVYHAYRWSSDNDTGVSAFGGRVMSRVGDFYAGLEGSLIAGSTREVSQAFSTITNDPPVSQSILQTGGRAVVRWDKRLFSVYLEADYASGDSDPEPRSPLTQFRFAPDTNVGLLMFKHTLAYQSARAAAAGVALLQDLRAPSYPTDAVDTRGSFTNAFAIFPQVDVHPIESVLLRAGVLMAWAPSKVVDPIASLQRRDGLRIDDDLVNFAGGAPSRFYGTEIDGRAQWRFLDHFAADLEGAVLFPGSAFEDANGDAVRSFLVQGRGTFFF